MKKKVLLVITILLIAAFLRADLWLPVNATQALESYQAYSILKTGKDITGHFSPFVILSLNDFTSPIPIFVRMPFVLLFGLNNISTYVPTILLGIALVGLSFFWTRLLIDREHMIFDEKDKKILQFLVPMLFAVSPWFIFSSLFNLSQVLAIFLFMAASIFWCYKIFRYAKILSSILFIVAIFANVYCLPLILGLIIFWNDEERVSLFRFVRYNVTWSGIAVAGVIVGFIVMIVYPTFRSTIIKNSFIGILEPAQYSWMADRRIAYDATMNRVVTFDGRNLNRVVHNKYFYSLNEYFTTVIKQFDYESLATPFQDETQLDLEGDNYIMFSKILFFEIFFIVGGLAILLKRNSKLPKLSLITLLPLVVFPKVSDLLIYFFPVAIFLEAVFLVRLWRWLDLKRVVIKITFGSLIFFWVYTIMIFMVILIHYPRVWMARNDYVGSVVWNYVKQHQNEFKEVTVTDLLGDQLPYLLYYLAYDPSLLQDQLQTHNGNATQIDKYRFASFKYFESDRKPQQLWIGVPGEFAGRYLNYDKIESVPDGLIVQKMSIKLMDQFWGREIWIVKTVF